MKTILAEGIFVSDIVILHEMSGRMLGKLPEAKDCVKCLLKADLLIEGEDMIL